MTNNVACAAVRGCFVAMLALLANTASGASPPSIETFAAYSDFGAVSLSPDGNRIAYTARVNGKRALIVLDLEKRTMKPILAAEEDSFQIRWCSFKTPQRLLCSLRGVEFSRAQPFPISRLIAINADGTGFKVMVQNGRNAIVAISGPRARLAGRRSVARAHPADPARQSSLHFPMSTRSTS